MIYTYNVRAYVYGYNRHEIGYEIRVLCVPPRDGHISFSDVKEFDLSPATTSIEDSDSRHVLTTTIPITEEKKCHGAIAMSIVAAISKSLKADVKTGTMEASYAEATLATWDHDTFVDFHTVNPKWMLKPTKREEEKPFVTYIVSPVAMFGGGRICDQRTKVDSVSSSAVTVGEKRVRDESAPLDH